MRARGSGRSSPGLIPAGAYPGVRPSSAQSPTESEVEIRSQLQSDPGASPQVAWSPISSVERSPPGKGGAAAEAALLTPRFHWRWSRRRREPSCSGPALGRVPRGRRHASTRSPRSTSEGEDFPDLTCTAMVPEDALVSAPARKPAAAVPAPAESPLRCGLRFIT